MIKVTQSRLDNLAKIFLLKVSMVTLQKFFREGAARQGL